MSRIGRFAIAFLLGILGNACGGEHASAPAQGYKLAFGIKNRTATLMVGTSVTLPIGLLSPAGDTMPLPPNVVLASRDPASVRVDGGSRITSLRFGTTMVVAWALVDGMILSDSMTITGACPAIYEMAVTPAAKTLVVGDSFTPVAVLSQCNGFVVQSDTFAWASSDASVVRVDSLSGEASGLRSGRANVRAISKRSGISRELTVTVVDR